jgi:regulator of sigma E protease
MVTLLIFLAVLSVLVLSHEWGHFFTARRNGIGVEEFGFGFPPRLFGIQRLIRTLPGGVHKRSWRVIWGAKQPLPPSDPAVIAGVIYSFNIIPLGGFVKIKGENGEAEGANDPDSFTSKKAWQKALVLTAGVIMNVLVAWVLLSIGLMIGTPQQTDTLTDVSRVVDRHIEIVDVLAGKPAAAAGIASGDRVVALDALQNPRLSELQNYVNDHRGQKIKVTIKRGSETLVKEIQPVVYEDTGKGGLGIAIAEIGTVRYPWYQAIYEGGKQTLLFLKEILFGFGALISDLFRGAAVGDQVSGPIGVAVMTGHVAKLGFIYLMQFTAMLSLNLAVLNILPIPALDGGRLLFVIIQKITKKGVAAKYEQIAHVAGFALLMLLVLVITVKDLSHFSGALSAAFHRVF